MLKRLLLRSKWQAKQLEKHTVHSLYVGKLYGGRVEEYGHNDCEAYSAKNFRLHQGPVALTVAKRLVEDHYRKLQKG